MDIAYLIESADDRIWNACPEESLPIQSAVKERKPIMKTAKCEDCGAEFERQTANQKYCRRCAYQSHRGQYKIAPIKLKKTTLTMSIGEIIKAATNLGLSYGEYVDKYLSEK